MKRDLVYEENNIVYDSDYPEFKYIKCNNYEICGEMFPKGLIEWGGWNMGIHKHYLCSECYSMFGNGHSEYHSREGVLKFCDTNRECPICLEVKPSIFQPKCEDTLCIDCFNRCYYGDRPTFPYPDDDVDNLEYHNLDPKWNIH